MLWLLCAGLLLAGCAANTPDHVVPHASDDAGEDVGADSAPQPSGLIEIQLGSREVPFQAWAEGDDVVVVQGPQGGFHTEHRAHVTGAGSVDELHLAIIYGEVWRDDLVFARAGWEFWDEQWESVDDAYEVELPALIFDERPDFGPAELRATVELTDGRHADYSMPIDLVDFP